jgi:integrase
MAEKYLIRRKLKHGKGEGGWAFRIGVPAALRTSFKSSKGRPLRHITVGLNTDSLSEARKLRDGKLAEWRLNFERALRGTPLTTAEIQAEAIDAYQYLLASLAAQSARGKFTNEEIALDATLDEIITALDQDDWEIIGAEIGATQRRKGIEIDPSSPTYAILAKAILMAMAQALTDRLRFLRGEMPEGIEKALGTLPVDPTTMKPLIATPIPRPVIPSEGGLRFADAAALCLEAQQRDPGATLRSSTIQLYQSIYRAFKDYSQNAPINAVTRSMAADFLAAIGAERNLTTSTLNKYAVVLSGVFKWAKKTGRLTGDNSFSEQSFKAAKDTGYLPFNDDELKALFSPDLLKPPISKPLPWAMLIALYSGMRLNEIAQLKVADIRTEHGIEIFDVREGEGQKLRTRATTRTIPVHSAVTQAGLLEYAKGLPKWGRLFPTLKAAGADEKLGAQVSYLFRRYRLSLGIDRERVNFHSLRKNFGSASDRAGIPASDREALLGHSRGFSLDVYSSGPGLHRLKELIEKVHYPSLGD